MKKLALFFIALTIFSCKQEVKVDYAILSGKIENAASEKITLYNSYERSDKKELTLENGQFTDTVKINNGNQFYLIQGKNNVSLFLTEGDKLNFSYDANKVDSTLTFTGNNSAISTYLVEKKINNKDIKLNTEDLYSLNEDDFITSVLKVKKAQEDFLYNATSLPESFIKNETSNINYEYLATISNYESYHTYFAKIKGGFKASDKITSKLKDLTYENENDFQFSSNFRSLVTKNYQNETADLVKADSIERDIAYLKTLATIKSDKIRNKLLFDDAKYGITFTKNLEDYYSLYSKASTNQYNNDKITEIYRNLKTLTKGNASPKFTDYENNAGGTTSLDDLKGKYVYMDIWATWCGPCIGEIPFLKKIEKLYHGKNIEFVSISIDKEADHEKWKKMIVDKELGGIQLFADNNWESQFIEDYSIKGIPRFILLDPQGNIVSANAPRPSNEKLIALFDELKI
ncbi:Thiol-disulfide isomerase or thioredoxin [Polaribacter sp. KT25b]|uniref:TlpA family protein disulfide reductase n=1 Tax=Polaribacter sp. KT25b TaxID=1855336 RepID=UPI00087B05D0|nr:TlpA disulfide reductase family protein [Polaribacter sp. KT25b]SDS42888.1 Thiol-disulfide isomerase or thioredoxin [Polaribacter sp. KT25b]